MSLILSFSSKHSTEVSLGFIHGLRYGYSQDTKFLLLIWVRKAVRCISSQTICLARTNAKYSTMWVKLIFFQKYQKICALHVMDGYGCWGRSPFILNLIVRWRWIVSFMPWPFTLVKGKRHQCPLNRRLGTFHRSYGLLGEEKVPFFSLGSNHDTSIWLARSLANFMEHYQFQINS
jgi:hypothetical protein